MQSVKIDATVGKDGTITLSGLPYREGERVNVSVNPHESSLQPDGESHPLSNLPATYIDPYEPACPPEDWEVLK
jgi:hypothetical protein